MSHYSDYSAKEFALDAGFQKWVLDKNDQADHFWSQFLQQHPGKKSEIDEAMELVRLAGLSLDEEANAAYLQIWNKVKANIDSKKPADRPVLRFAPWAAAFAGIVAVLLYFSLSGSKSIEYATGYGEIKEIKLQDGSIVTLNANSKLEVSPADRQVLLQGEAFFKVVKTKDKKTFQVKTIEGLSVLVLGTEFNVNARRKNLTVYLQSGKVRLYSADVEATLQPGEQANFNKVTKRLVVDQVADAQAAGLLAWKSGLYVMNDISLSEVAQHIEESFGVSVIIEDTTLAQTRVTAKVPAENLDILLKVLSETLDIKTDRKENQVIIKSLN